MQYFRKDRRPPFGRSGTPYNASDTTYVAGEYDKDDPTMLRSDIEVHVTHRPEYTHTYDVDLDTIQNYYPKNAQLPLFAYDVTPAKHEVASVSGTERGRTHFPLLLSMANNDSMKRYNRPLEAPTDLSKHSLKIVKNLQQRGVIERNPEIPAYPTNDITFEDDPDYVVSHGFEKIGNEEKVEGKESLRRMLGRRKNLSPQFDEIHEQLKLDGF